MKQRLIDANALLEALNNKRDNDDFASFKDAIRMLESAPTVETTDDVIARLPKMIGDFCLESGYTGGSWYAWYSKFEYEYIIMKGTEFRGDTQFEAVKELEATLNQK